MRDFAPRSIRATAPSILVTLASLISMGFGGSAPAAESAAPAPAPAVELSPPRLLLEALERTSPGWETVESESGPQGGRLVIERMVWPLFYLHWRPLAGEGGVGGKLSLSEAENAVAGLWKGQDLVPPPQGRKVSLPAHDAVLIESITSHGEWKSRYFVWACPESGRLFIADLNVSLLAQAPPSLFELMTSMTRSVRCHPGATIEEAQGLSRRREIPATDLSYGIPYTWAPVAGYRVQSVFGIGKFSSQDHAAVTKEAGQELALELDAVRRLHVLWQAAPDSAMTFDALIQQVHAFWQERSNNMMPAGTKVSNDVWMMDGLVRSRNNPAVPPARMHKFRAWAWRKNGTAYLAVGQLGGVRFGQRVMTEVQDIADPMLEEMFQSIEY